jgi:hypothetical protein
LPKTSSAASHRQRHGCSWPPSSSSLDASQNYDIKHDNYESDSEGSNEEAVLLSKDGKVVQTVKQHNDAVRVDVAKTIGPKLAGLEE